MLHIRKRALAGASKISLRLERKDAGATMEEVKKSVDEFMQGFETFKTKNDERLKQIETKGGADAVTKAELKALDDALTEIKKDVNAAIADMKRPKLDAKGKETTPERAEYSKKFEDWFRTGAGDYQGSPGEYKAMQELERKASLSSQSNTDGGFTVRPEMENVIDETVKQVSPMRDLATVRQISALEYKALTNVHGTSSGWVGEGDTRAQTLAPQLKELVFPAMELYAMPAATQQLLDDSYMNIDQWVADEVALEFAQQEGAAFVTGNGVKKPWGFLGYATVANASWAWEKVGYVVTGNSGDFAAPSGATTQGDNLIDLYHSLKPAYRKNATFAMNNATLSKARKLKDGQNNYLINVHFADDGIVERIMGKPVVEMPDMPDPAANSMSVAFGDFKRGYIIVDRVGIRTLRDPFTAKPYILFYTTKRVGGGIRNFEAIKLLKFGTS